VTPKRRASGHIEFPNDLEIVLTREFDAPIQLVFDVLTKPEHVRKTIAPYGEEVKTCTTGGLASRPSRLWNCAKPTE
jgi:uncharacterized protein YndB with AHSA1/START domain